MAIMQLIGHPALIIQGQVENYDEKAEEYAVIDVVGHGFLLTLLLCLFEIILARLSGTIKDARTRRVPAGKGETLQLVGVFSGGLRKPSK